MWPPDSKMPAGRSPCLCESSALEPVILIQHYFLSDSVPFMHAESSYTLSLILKMSKRFGVGMMIYRPTVITQYVPSVIQAFQVQYSQSNYVAYEAI